VIVEGGIAGDVNHAIKQRVGACSVILSAPNGLERTKPAGLDPQPLPKGSAQMSHRIAAIAFALTLATAGVAQAQSPPAPTVDVPGGSVIALREVAAIGTGVIVGAALWHVVIGHGFMLAGAAVGGWLGDWYYNNHASPAPHTGG
jgi:hypothetical protein